MITVIAPVIKHRKSPKLKFTAADGKYYSTACANCDFVCLSIYAPALSAAMIFYSDNER